jgi:hypothetical protein
MFPLVMLIIALLSVTVVYMMWFNTDPDAFVRLEGPSRKAAAVASSSPPDDMFANLNAALAEPDPPASSKPLEHSPMSGATSIPEPQASPPGAPPAADEHAVEVLRVLRMHEDGSLLVEINGHRYESLGAIDDRKTFKRFLINVRDLAAFARLDKIDVPDMPLSELLPPPQGKPPAQPPPPAPSAPIMAEVVEGEDVVPWEQMTIAQQIDRVLQAQLRENPAYAQRMIRIYQAPTGGIRIEADGATYNGVDEITDPEVKQIIQRAIATWEESA